MSKKALLNYTTQIPVDRTIGEIETILAREGAKKILKDYDGSGNLTAVSFMVKTDKGLMPFKLPMNVRAVMQVINDQTNQYVTKSYGRKRVVPKRYYNDLEQARRVGWRIIKDWIQSQMAMVTLNMVKIQEVFLPYVLGIDGKTLYEHLEGIDFKGYLLEDKKDGGE